MTKRQAMGASARMKRRLRRLEARIAELERERLPIVVINGSEWRPVPAFSDEPGEVRLVPSAPVEVVR